MKPLYGYPKFNLYPQKLETIGSHHGLNKYVSTKLLLIPYEILILPYVTHCGITLDKHIHKKFIFKEKILGIIDSDPYNQHLDTILKNMTSSQSMNLFTIIVQYSYINLKIHCYPIYLITFTVLMLIVITMKLLA